MEHIVWGFINTVFSSLRKYIFLFAFGVSIYSSYWYVLKKYRYVQSLQGRFWLTSSQKLVYIGRHMFISIGFSMLMYGVIIYLMFFRYPLKEDNYVAMDYRIASIQEIPKKTDLLTYFKSAPNDFVQPINFVFITTGDIQYLLKRSGWIKNEMFGRSRISVNRYVHLLREDTPPVSYLFLDGHPQDLAFQFASQSIVSRVHLRLWSFGHMGTRFIWLGSISKDKEMDLSFYQHFPAPMHDIQRNVDISREFLRTNILEHFPHALAYYTPWLQARMADGTKNGDIEFQSDGSLLILRVPHGRDGACNIDKKSCR